MDELGLFCPAKLLDSQRPQIKTANLIYSELMRRAWATTGLDDPIGGLFPISKYVAINIQQQLGRAAERHQDARDASPNVPNAGHHKAIKTYVEQTERG